MIDSIVAKLGGKKRSPKWRTVRNEFIKSNGVCACCGTKRNLHVHHIEPFAIAPERELDTDNLITLCARCHLFVGHCAWWGAYNPSLKESIYYLRVMLQARRACSFGFARPRTWITKLARYLLRKWYHFD